MFHKSLRIDGLLGMLAIFVFAFSVASSSNSAFAGGFGEPEDPPIPEVIPGIHSFVFTGECLVDCNGTASASLTLQEYVLGDPFTAANILAFDYFSDFPAFSGFEMIFDEALTATGVLFGTPNEFTAVEISGNFFNDFEDRGFFTFSTRVDETRTVENEEVVVDWIMEAVFFRPPVDEEQDQTLLSDPFDDAGVNGVFNPVPEPGTLALFGISLIGLGAMARRRRKVA